MTRKSRTALFKNARLRVILVVVTSLLSLLAVALIQMNRGVHEQIDALATANTDSVQWSLAQSDIELLSLSNAIISAIADSPPSLSSVRTHFDVFFSRAETLRNSPMLQALREDSEVVVAMDRIDAFLSETVLLVDGGDQGLRDALPVLRDRTTALRNDVRLINLKGISILSGASVSQRSKIAETLDLVSYLALALFCVLVLSSLTSLYFLSQASRRAVEQGQIRSRLSAMVSSALDAVMAVDTDGNIIAYNEAAEAIFGYRRDEAMGQKMEDLIVPDHFKEAHRAGMERYRKTGQKHVIGKGRVQLEARRKNGEVFPVELSIASAQSEEGEIFVSFLRDISQRIAAEQELIEARDEAVAGEKAKADLIAVMSHEMRTPLNGILGTLALFDTEKQSPKDREYLEIIQASGKLLLHHVDNVLEISRAEAGKIEIAEVVFSVPALVQELVASQRGVAEHRGNTLSTLVDAWEESYAVGDATRIRQILLNLIGNAIKFTRNGSITVEAKRLSQHDLVEFRVTDTGIGIPAKDHERIFEDFVTLDPSFSRAVGGTGLGLAIVRRLVRALGGTIGLESTSGYGSSFWFRVPLPATQQNPKEQAPDTNTRATGRAGVARPMKVLVVEDDRINRVVITDLLKKDGHEVDEAFNGQEGLDAVIANTYDLVLMDISMPVMDGIQATRAIRNAKPDGALPPIVALTANAIPSEKDRFLAAGLDDVLIKPFTPEALRHILIRYSKDAHSRPELDLSYNSTFDAMVDHNHLEGLSSALGQGKIEDLVTSFIAEADVAIDKIAVGLASDNERKALRETVHQMVGTAAFLGAEKLRTTLAQLEEDIVEDRSLGTDVGQELKIIWLKTVPELRLHLKRSVSDHTP